jgi:hypothetical protein
MCTNFEYRIPSQDGSVLWEFNGSGVTVQGPENLDHFDQLRIRDRHEKADVIYVRGWTSSAESPSWKWS